MAQDKLLQMRVDERFLNIIDTWREQNGGTAAVTRTEAVRMLVEMGAEAWGSRRTAPSRRSPEKSEPLTIESFDGALNWHNRLRELRLEITHDGVDPVVLGDRLALTNRELEVLKEMANGKRNQEIAEQLALSTQTVKNHLHTIAKKYMLYRRLERDRKLSELRKS